MTVIKLIGLDPFLGDLVFPPISDSSGLLCWLKNSYGPDGFSVKRTV